MKVNDIVRVINPNSQWVHLVGHVTSVVATAFPEDTPTVFVQFGGRLATRTNKLPFGASELMVLPAWLS